MSDNNLIPVRRLLPERIRKEEKEETFAVVSYEKNDSASERLRTTKST